MGHAVRVIGAYHAQGPGGGSTRPVAGSHHCLPHVGFVALDCRALDDAPMRRWLILALVTGLAAVLVSSASATVRITKAPGRVARGGSASVTVTVSPKARCTIGVYYSTTTSRARGLGPKTANTITWTWTVGSTTKTGRWPIKIDCGKSGKAETSITVSR